MVISNKNTVLVDCKLLYHVAIPTDVSLLSLGMRRSRAAGLQRMQYDKYGAARVLVGCKPIIIGGIYIWTLKFWALTNSLAQIFT